jgi:uncharacterized protein (TIRG00374 family)
VKRPSPGGLLRVLVAVALTGYMLRDANPAEVWRVSVNASPRFLAAAAALVLLDRALMAYRWLVLLRPLTAASHLSLRPVMRIFFVSTFVGTFLPASVGGDAVRAYGLARQQVPGAAAVASVFMDRMLGVLSVLLMAGVGLVFAADLAGNRYILAGLAVSVGACGVTAALVFSGTAARAASSLISRFPWDRASRIAQKLLAAIQSYANAHRELLNVLAGSIAVQVLRIVQAYYLGRALGITAPLAAYFAFVPLILLVMLLPVTVNGLGTSQWAFVWLFARAGVGAAEAFALSVLFVALGVVGNLPGALLYLTGGLHGRSQPEVTP